METLASSMLVRDAVPADLDEIAELIKVYILYLDTHSTFSGLIISLVFTERS